MTIRRFAIFLLIAAACGEAKLPEPGIDYGPEEAAPSAKDDSATNPASMARLTFDRALRTTFTSTSRWRAFKFAGTAGEKVDVLVDGLRGLDTVAFIYNVSATTGRPYGRPIASNDDTEEAGWTSNELSSSILGFAPRYSREYAVVVTTYRQAGRGTATVLVRRSPVAAGPFVAGGSGRFVDLAGLRAEVMILAPGIRDLLSTTPSDLPTFAEAYRLAPAALRSAFAPGGPAVVGAAFRDSLGIPADDEFGAYLASDSVIDPTPPQRLGATLAEMLSGHVRLSDADSAKVRANYDRLGAAAIADGVTHAFTVRMEESGDWSYLAVVVANVDSGSLRVIGIRRDP
jgi:hypothetical protein